MPDVFGAYPLVRGIPDTVRSLALVGTWVAGRVRD